MNDLLNQITTGWYEIASKAVVDTVNANPEASYYAAGFWMFYVDYAVMGVPCFGLNTEEHLAATDEGSRWAPADWILDVHDSIDSLQPLYDEVSDTLEEDEEEVWDTFIEEHYAAIATLCRKLTEDYHASSGPFAELVNKNPNFVFAILKDDDEEEVFQSLLDASVDPKRKARLKGL